MVKKSIPMEKLIWAFIVIFNFLAIITMFEFGLFIETMIWADVWIFIAFKFETVVKTYITVKIASMSNKGKKS